MSWKGESNSADMSRTLNVSISASNAIVFWSQRLIIPSIYTFFYVDLSLWEVTFLITIYDLYYFIFLTRLMRASLATT